MAWFSETSLQLCRSAWQQADVEQRYKLSVVDCFCKAMYLRVAREILENTTTRAEREAAEKLHLLGAMTWGAELTTLFMLNEDFCQREDGFEFMLSRCHRNEDQVLELLAACSSNSIGVSTGNRALLCGRASTWNDLASDAWTILAVSYCAKVMAADLRGLGSLRLLHASLKPPEPSRLRSWPCKKSFAQLKEFWKVLDVKGRKSMAELRAEMCWYVQACDVAMVALSLVHLQRNGVHLPVTEALLKQFRDSSKLLSQLAREECRITLSEDFCARPEALDVLYAKAVWHVPQKEAVLKAAFQCNWREAVCGPLPYPLVAAKGTLYSDVERVTATLLLERLLNAAHLLTLAEADTDRNRREAERRRQQASQDKKKKQKAKAAAERKKGSPEQGFGTISHAERYLVHKLLATAPSWDASLLRVRWTFFELEDGSSEEQLAAPLYWDC